jgi:hypothetical protein
VEAASTAEGIQLDETAGEAMGIEWAKGVTSGGGGESARPPASSKARARGPLVVGRRGIAVGRGGSGASLSCAASSLLSSGAELGRSARV